MTICDFLKDKGLLLLLHLTCMAILAGFLKVTGYRGENTLLILIFWGLILLLWLLVAYLKRKRFFREAEEILEKTDQRYLLGELPPDSPILEDRLYRELIRKSNKSVIERIRKIEDAQKEYREYIESWIHEVKAPITGIALLGENGRKGIQTAEETRDIFRTICLENRKIENYVEMALYYARSNEVYKDYLIQETNLEEVVNEVLEQNRLLLIRNGVRAEVKCEDCAFTDKKWILFILNQLILNSVKYRSESPVFRIYTKKLTSGVALVFQDNGTGIPDEEMGRIFDKGFTGTNGRDHQRSTGMGLYLCKKLCTKLGIRIYAESVYGQGTTIFLEFPVSSYLTKL